MSKTLSELQVEIRNLLIEHEVEPFVVIGFRNQDEFVLQQTRGSVDLRALNDLCQEQFQLWYGEDEDEIEFESDMDFDDDD